jgi:hypothetical protein
VSVAGKECWWEHWREGWLEDRLAFEMGFGKDEEWELVLALLWAGETEARKAQGLEVELALK